MFQLPKLSYAYNALEPVIDEETVKLHHDKHHQTYLDKLNASLEKYPDFFEKTAEDLIANLEKVPADIREAVRNNGGGYVNHNLYWDVLGPSRGDDNQPVGMLAEAIGRDLGDFATLKKELSEAAITRFGSGWAWLVCNSEGRLQVMTTINQDSPLSDGLFPLLNIDVWEHAYYLKYQNRRAEYVEKIFAIFNWEEVARRYGGYIKNKN